jgi:hypothetical protein
MAKVRVLIQLEPQQMVELRKLKAKTGAAISELIRRMIAAGWDKVAK